LLSLFSISALSTMWFGSILILKPSCDLERDRAVRAEQQVSRLEAVVRPSYQDTARHEIGEALQRQISDLEQNLAEQRRACGISGYSNEQARAMSAGSVQSMQNEIHQLRGQIHDLQEKLREAVPRSFTSTVESSANARLGGFLARGAGGASSFGTGADAVPVRISLENVRSWAAEDAIGVVVISCKRPRYLERAMSSFLKWRRDSAQAQFPIVISQDGDDAAMTDMVESKYVATGLAFHIRHKHEASAQKIAQQHRNVPSALGYVRIAQHYGFAMKTMFDDFGFRQVIFLEEDMEVAPDFFSYFSATLPLLRTDGDLFCVSAWNDIGAKSLAEDPRAIFRTDFFPGLGWMMYKSMWAEVRDRWAEAFWDEFMRRPDVRRGRHCIRPEVSRTMTFGEEGTSAGQFFKEHLSLIKLNDQPVDWANEDLSALASRGSYDEYLARSLGQATRTTKDEVDKHAAPGASLRIEYDDKRDYASIASKFGLMKDEKEGIRRMSYRGVIPFTWRGARVFIYTSQWPGGLP